MQTLVSDPFEDDPAEFLEWAYGKLAGFEMRDRMFARNERAGQAFMKVVRKYDLEGYQRILGLLGDPSYDDRKIPMALDILTSK